MSNWFEKSAAQTQEIQDGGQVKKSPTVDAKSIIESDATIMGMIAWFQSLQAMNDYLPTARQDLDRALEAKGITDENIPQDVKAYLQKVIK